MASSSNQCWRKKHKNVQESDKSHHLIYRSKLYQALSKSRQNFTSPATPHIVKSTADRLLAISRHGKTRWSRAILCTRIRRRKSKVRVAGEAKSKSRIRSRGLLDPRLKILGRLIPGCRKASVSSLLQEASDYIGALQMQVKAMSELALILSITPS